LLTRSTRSLLTFSSQRRGRCRRISSGSVSAVRMMNSAIPRFRVFVAVAHVSTLPSGAEFGRTHTLVGTLLQHLVCVRLLNEVHDLHGASEWPGYATSEHTRSPGSLAQRRPLAKLFRGSLPFCNRVRWGDLTKRSLVEMCKSRQEAKALRDPSHSSRILPPHKVSNILT
jgi:hypothetical protein